MPNRLKLLKKGSGWLLVLALAAIIAIFYLVLIARNRDRYAFLRAYNPQEVWISNLALARLEGHPIHCFRFHQTLEVLGGAFGLSPIQVRQYKNDFATKDLMSFSTVNPKLPSGVSAALVPSKVPGFKWELRLPDDWPPAK